MSRAAFDFDRAGDCNGCKFQISTLAFLALLSVGMLAITGCTQAIDAQTAHYVSRGDYARMASCFARQAKQHAFWGEPVSFERYEDTPEVKVMSGVSVAGTYPRPLWEIDFRPLSVNRVELVVHGTSPHLRPYREPVNAELHACGLDADVGM